jgi:thioesterase domain-containing protein
VPLNSSGTKTPLFCIHMHNGNIHRWRVLLKHLGNDQPVYAIQPRGLDVKQQPHHNIEEMASYYIDVMKQVQPQGPYNLLGLCFSGMVVFEMGLQLQRRGEKVNFLGMINNYAPPENPTLYRVKTGINKFMRMEMGERLNYVMEKNLSIGKTIFSKAKSIIGGNVKVEKYRSTKHLPARWLVTTCVPFIHWLCLIIILLKFMTVISQLYGLENL